MSRNKKRVSVCIVVLMLAVVTLLSGCKTVNQPSTLQDYIVEDEGMMEELQEFAVAKGLSDLRIEGNRMIFEYSYEEKFTEEQLARVAEELDKELDQVASDFSELAMNIGEAIEVEGIIVTVEYRDGAGKEVLVRDFTTDDLKEQD